MNRYEPPLPSMRTFDSDQVLSDNDATLDFNIHGLLSKRDDQSLDKAGTKAREFHRLLGNIVGLNDMLILQPHSFTLTAREDLWPVIEETVREAVRMAYGFQDVILQEFE